MSYRKRIIGVKPQQGFSTSFIEHYLLAVIYPDGLTRFVHIALGVGVVVFNALVYGVLVMKSRNSRLLLI